MIEFPLWDYFEDIELFEEGMNLAFINGIDEQNEDIDKDERGYE